MSKWACVSKHVSKWVGKTGYEGVHEWVSKQRCEQVSIWLIEKTASKHVSACMWPSEQISEHNNLWVSAWLSEQACMSISENELAGEHKCMIYRKIKQLNMCEQACEQVSAWVSLTVYERVHEWVRKHMCEQVSRSEQVSLSVWLIEKNEQVSITVYEEVHEWVSKHMFEQGSKWA